VSKSRYHGIMGSGRIPGYLGRITSSMGSLLNIGVKKREVTIFEPDPASGWTSSLQMKNYSGKPIVILPPKYSEVRQGRTDPRDGAVISVPLATFKRAFESVVQLRA
jgi:hypothetical protein